MDLDLSLLPQAAAQMRGALSSLYFAAARLAPAAAREQAPELDAKAALVDQSYYRLIRMVNDLTATRYLNATDTRGKKRKQVIDAVAATVILESYLVWRKNHPGEEEPHGTL